MILLKKNISRLEYTLPVVNHAQRSNFYAFRIIIRKQVKKVTFLIKNNYAFTLYPQVLQALLSLTYHLQRVCLL